MECWYRFSCFDLGLTPGEQGELSEHVSVCPQRCLCEKGRVASSSPEGPRPPGLNGRRLTLKIHLGTLWWTSHCVHFQKSSVVIFMFGMRCKMNHCLAKSCAFFQGSDLNNKKLGLTWWGSVRTLCLLNRFLMPHCIPSCQLHCHLADHPKRLTQRLLSTFIFTCSSKEWIQWPWGF